MDSEKDDEYLENRPDYEYGSSRPDYEDLRETDYDGDAI